LLLRFGKAIIQKRYEDYLESLQLDHYPIDKCSFIGPSYDRGIILRLAAYYPEKIACSVLTTPAGLKLGSKFAMIRKILLPMILYKTTSSETQLQCQTSA
jgi:pimeloyl-ACP methyl ester carboxylesterase